MNQYLERLRYELETIQRRQYSPYISYSLKLYDKLWNKHININGYVYPVSMVDVLKGRKVSWLENRKELISRKYWNNPQWVRTNGCLIIGVNR